MYKQRPAANTNGIFNRFVTVFAAVTPTKPAYKNRRGLSARCFFSFLFTARKTLSFIHLESILPEQTTPRARHKPRHTLLGHAIKTFQTGQSTRGCADPRRLTPTKHYSLRS
jgi:hypothetical protein